MPDDIDDIADSLGAVRAGRELSSLPVSRVVDGEDAVVLCLKTPAGNVFRRELKRPPVWGANCDLKRLLDACGLGPGEVTALEGRDLPVRRDVVEGSPRFELDFERLES